MKGLKIAVIFSAVLVLAITSIFIALKLEEMGTKPVAPNAPQSKPKAVDEDLPPADAVFAPACKLVFNSTVTPTLTPTPSLTLTPVPVTSTPVPTATNTPGPETSGCDYLQADKTSGSAPLTVTFKGKGNDTVRIKSYKFTFGDGEQKEFTGSFTSSQIQEVTHIYTKAGTWTAILEIMDDGDHWRTKIECRQTITVSGGTTPTTITTPKATKTPTLVVVRPTVEVQPTDVELPKAGIKIPTLGGIMGGFLLLAVGLALIF